MPDSLGDRMKNNYEKRAKHMLTRRTPVIIRVDGKAFHTFTRGCAKPFDHGFITAMLASVEETACTMQGFKLAFVQSDEASFLLTDYDDITTEAWFGYCQNKIESVTASTMTAHFNQKFYFPGDEDHGLAVFDARAFNIPREEVANYFLWRAQDWARNSLQMLARAHFSHSELHKVNQAGMHEMLHKIGINWADRTDFEKNGTWIVNRPRGMFIAHNILPEWEMIEALLEGVR